MKQLHGNSLVLGAAALTFLAAQPVWAQITQVNDVKLNPVNGGISVVLKTSTGSRPQVFTTKRGKALVTDIINTQLRLPQGNNFRQDNPSAGISSVEVVQLDANSIRVIVTGSNNAPDTQPVVRQQNGITLGFTPSSGTTASAPTPPTTPTAPRPATPSAAVPPSPSAQKPDVLVPNPEVTIDGKPAQAAGPGQPISQAPPFLPRAVAPPVGDIAISATDASPSTIDLGTQERVPRLVLRDAPVREVLSLLARAAGLNLAYVGGGGDDKGAVVTESQGTGDTEKLIYQKVSLDIENEPVQDVFNYVLRLSGLEANRSGRTVFVAPKLPNSTRDVVVRNLRINQAKVKEILRVLVNLGAESAVNAEPKLTRVTTQVVGTEEGKKINTAEDSDLTAQRIKFTDSIPLLRGLQVLGDERTSTVTLIGSPRLVDIAMAQITPLDIRRRQVAVNVRIIDVNLNNTQDYNTSFSFGVGNNYFTNDGGVAVLNFNGSRPATSSEVANSLTNTPIINNVVSNVALPYQFPKRLLASLQAQVTSGNAKILTDPTLIVQEGQTADVKLTQQVVGDIKRTITDTPGGSREEQDIQKETVGLILAVQIERIDDNGFVSLQVAPQVKSPAGTANTGDGQIILISERSLTSGTIRLRDGQTLILSGIIQDQDRTSVSKIPILGDLPLIGSLFRSTNRSNQRQEVIVLLTPQIMDDTENSAYGYNYTPSPEVRNVLERRGLKTPNK